MKRRSWLWFIASAVLAVLAGVLAIFALNWAAQRETPEAPVPKQPVTLSQYSRRVAELRRLRPPGREQATGSKRLRQAIGTNVGRDGIHRRRVA